jgi:CheY-like chemotaxis protein
MNAMSSRSAALRLLQSEPEEQEEEGLSDHDPHGVPGVAIETRPDTRSDERSVRVLLVEDRPIFARIVRWALARATRGRFQIEQAGFFAQAVRRLEQELFDAILVDLGPRVGDEAEAAFDAAEELAHRVPVIVLTGTHVEVPETAARQEEIAAYVQREHFECERLPCTILDAIKRHRRVGQLGADPIIYRLHD